METVTSRPLFTIKFVDIYITDNNEVNNDLKFLMSESNMEISRKYINKNYTFDSSFMELEKVSKEKFYDEYKDNDLNSVVYYAKNYYKVREEKINRLEERYGRAYRRMDLEKLTELFKNKVISEMFKKYNPLIKEDYVEKFKENIKNKLLTFMMKQVSPRDIIFFKRALEQNNLDIKVIDLIETEINISIELNPRFSPRVILDIERNRDSLDDFFIYDEELQLDEEFRDLEFIDLESRFPPLGVSVTPDLNIDRRVESIVQTQAVTENGNDLDEEQMAELQRRFNALISDEPNVNIQDEERSTALDRRLEELRTIQPQNTNQDDLEDRFNRLAEEMSTDTDLRNELEELVNQDTNNSEERLNRLAEEMSTDTDLRNELEELMNQNGGGNTQSKMTLFDDLDSDDEFSDKIDSDEKFNITVKSQPNLHKLGMDEMTYLLNSIKINNGCDDVIRFCQVSKSIASDCRKIPEIREIYMPCMAETMIMKVNSLDVNLDSMNLNRKKLLELEKEKNGTVYDYLNKNLDCSHLLKKKLLEIIDESIRQVYIHISEDFLKIMNIKKIPISFLIYTIKNIKDIFNSNITTQFDTFSVSVKNKSKPILEYQLAKIETLNDTDTYDIYRCFIKYLEILINYDIDDIL